MAEPPLNGVAETEYTKSHQRELSTLFENSPPRARVSRTSHAWQVRAANIKKLKSVVLRSPQLHATTRANIAHEKAEQIRARIVCTPAG